MSKKRESLHSFQVNYGHSSSFPISPVDLTVIHISPSEDKPENAMKAFGSPVRLTGIYFQKRMFQKSSQQG